MKIHRLLMIYATTFSVCVASCTHYQVDENQTSAKDSSEHLILISETVQIAENLNSQAEKSVLLNDGIITAVVEIPAGTTAKWEFDKNKKVMTRDLVKGQPRTINYLAYPANYGMIPGTLLPKDIGGDGDPLDIVILGESTERGTAVQCIAVGILKLVDNGEIDDKVIAVDQSSLLSNVATLSDLQTEYEGITEIIEIWFSHYKGKGEITSLGFGDENDARRMIQKASSAFKKTTDILPADNN